MRSTAFTACRGLTSLTIPDSVTTIDGCAFQACSSLTSVTISGGVTAIRSQAFDQCANLARITIPGSVTFIGDDVFRGCASLTDVHYGGSESQWGQILCGGYNVGIGAYQEVPFANGGQETAGLTGAAIHYNRAGN